VDSPDAKRDYIKAASLVRGGQVHTFVVELLQCPHCRGALIWTLTEQSGDRIEEGTAHCVACGATYPVREGIGLFLTPELPRDDLWEQAGSGLTAHLGEHPDVERWLMDVRLEALGASDLFFRAMVHEDHGELAAAKAAAKLAHHRLYQEKALHPPA
jgi:uncharacterized protein YbaR (Trm112 family)